MYKVSFTGYRPQKLPFFGEDDPMCVDLKQRISRQIEKLADSGAGEFFTGMAMGVDMWCAEAVLALKSSRPEIKLTAVLPCRGQESKWSAAEQRRYREILSRCDKVLCLSERILLALLQPQPLHPSSKCSSSRRFPCFSV